MTTDIHPLWESLTRELSSILDAHGVCAVAAYEIAVHTGVTTLVGLSDPQGDYYDIWICPPNGDITQTRWDSQQATFPVLLSNGPARQEKLGLPPKEVLNSELWYLAHDAVVAAPLPLPKGQYELIPEGALCLIDPPPNCPVDAQALAMLSLHITVFLDRAFLRQKAMQQDIEFNLVYDLTYSLTSTLNVDSIFGQISDPIRRILNVETVSIGLVDQVSGEVVFVDSLMGPMFEHLPPIRLQPGQGIAGWVAANGEPLIVNNVYRDRRFFQSVDQSSGFQTQSILCVPLQVEQQVVGVLEAINKRSGKFNDYDLRLLQAIVGPLAAALQNAWLHEDVLAEKRRVETIFANMSEGMLTVNREGRISATNDAFLALIKQPDAVLIGEHATEAIQLSTAGGFGSFMEQVLHGTQDTPQLACDLMGANGEAVPVLISGASIQDEEGEISEAIYVFSDLRQIREVERMRDDFFHNIVHELRTPLATILMYARLLREGKADEDPAKADRFLGVIERESDRLQRMVRQMLQVSKLDAAEIQRSSELVNLNQMFDDMLPTLADRAIQKGLTFGHRIPADLPMVQGNQETLYMIFNNLIDNAIKFTMSGSVNVRVTTLNSSVKVEVQDQGIGIAQESLPNLFKRFYRTKLAVERGIAGSGLGLYMVREALEKHKGSIEVQSKEGEGTTFLVRLPAVEE